MKSNRGWCCAVLLLSGAYALGQANQGSITGTVRDQTGAVVPNAPVVVKNSATGALYNGGASDTGNFVVPVPTGSYEMTVSVSGFKKFVQTGVPVVEGIATRRDVQLEVGAVTDVVTVTDQAPLLKTESGDMSYRVTSQLANQLPVLPTAGGSWFGNTAMGNIRNPLSAVQLLPGVQFSNDQTLMVNGLPSNSQTITIEGQDSTGTLWKVIQQQSQGSLDAVEAMAVQTSNFSAEFGKAGGGVINYTMKSGTNQYHGSVYDYMVNEFLNSGTPFTDAVTVDPARAGQHIRNVVRRSDYGFTFGGPLKLGKIYNGQDKTFFFVSFEQFRQNSRIGNGVATVPTADYRNGDFSNAGCFAFIPGVGCVFRPDVTNLDGSPSVDPLGNKLIFGGVYDPSTSRTVNGSLVRTQFPGNKIPANLFDSVSKNIQALVPAANGSGLVNNYNIPAYTNYQHTTIPSIKLDQNLSSTLKMQFYWGVNMNQSPNANGFTQAFTSATESNTRNHTIRLNIDKTITPTLLLHVGVGYFYQRQPTIAKAFDASTLGLKGFPYEKIFPTLGGLNNFFSGGFSTGGFDLFNGSMGASFDAVAWEQKPTANINVTWVKGNHNYKFGGDLTITGYPTHNNWRSNGNFSFAGSAFNGSAPTSNPWQFGRAFNFSEPSGFQWASFLMGLPNNMQVSQQTSTKLGGHAIAFFAQDNWKVTRKLTVEYGLRWDYQTYLREQYGRMQTASFSTPNPTVGGLLGAVAYEGNAPGRCKCQFAHNYPLAFGPRVSLSYQLRPKTVVRAGFGVTYGVLQTAAGVNFSVADYYSLNAPGYGVSPLPKGLQAGNPYAPGNTFGNPTLDWPNFDVGKYPTAANGLLTPQSPFILYNPGARPGRIAQWSIGLQHELIRNLVIEATYVGNRGAWFYAPLLNEMAYNSLTPAQLGRYGLNIKNPADQLLLTSRIDSPAAAAHGLFAPYKGFPSDQLVNQALRPVPQWNSGVNPYLGPANGNTWYDALQFQATKRYSHNLDLTVNFTYSHASVNGASQDTDFFLPGRPVVVDPYNRANNKQLNQLNPPLKTVISGTYTTPSLHGDSRFSKLTSLVLRDWQIGGVFQYQSGQLLQTPNSNNQLPQQMLIAPPGNFGPAYYNPWNRVSGQSLYAQGFDPNSSFDPRSTVVLNPGAWKNPASGEWGVSAPFYEGFRWRRKPNEAFNFGRNFRFGQDRKYNLQIRAEFQNIFNRTFYSAPDTSNPAAAVTTTTQGTTTFYSGGFGVVNTVNGAGSAPRSGTLVGRFTF